MAHAVGGTGFWRSVRELPGRVPLRVKLMSALLALVTLALVVISVAGIAILKNNLLSPYDTDLQANFRSATQAVGEFISSGGHNSGSQPGIAVDWIPAGGSAKRVIQPGTSSFPGNFGNFFGGSGTTSPGPAIQSDHAWISAHLNSYFTVSATSGGARWRVLMESVTFSNGQSGTVVLATNVSNVYTTIGKLTGIDLLVSLAIIVLLGIVGLGLIRASLRPLNDIEETAGAIAAGDLSRRVPERDPRTEVGRLGRSLNTMLGQIESSFRARAQSEAAARRSEERMRQFVADASHELRTPLTAIRGFAEYYRQRGGVETNGGVAAPSPSGTVSGELGPGTGTDAGAVAGGTGTDAGGMTSDTGSGTSSEQNETRSRKGPLAGADMDRIMRRVEQESARMGVLVEDMLLLARMDQQRPLESRPVDLLTLAADAIHDARVVAPGRSINLTVDASQAPIVIGDEVRLRQVIGNLMSNALNHTPDGTPIEVLIRSGSLGEALRATAMAQPAAPNPSHPAVVLDVTDHGPGLDQDQAEHVFERFFRADAARTHGGGTGLGLAIVAALAVAHGGAAWVQSRPGEGATFSIALPLSPDAVQGIEEEDSDLDGLGDDPYSAADDGFGYDGYSAPDDGAADDPAADVPPADDPAALGQAEQGQAEQGQAEPPWLDSAGRTRGNII